MRQLSPRAPTFGHVFQSDHREISPQRVTHAGFYLVLSPIPVLRATDTAPLPVRNSQPSENIDFTPSGKQPRCWRSPGFRQQACSGWSRFFNQMSKYRPDHPWVFNTSDDPDVTTAFTAVFYIDIEHPLQPLCPGHGCPALGRRLVLIK